MQKELDAKLVESMITAVDYLFQCVKVDIIMYKMKNVRLISWIYKASGDDIEVFIEYIELLKKYINNKDILICGDFNFDSLKVKLDSKKHV